MRFYTLDQLYLPHIEAANGVIVGNDDRRFIVLFIDDCGEVVGMFDYLCPDDDPWRDFKLQYIDICRRIAAKPWRAPYNIDMLYNYARSLMQPM